MEESRRRRERLYSVAERQQGLFTARQAAEAGYDPRNHSFHVRKGNWLREARGIYRLSRFPRTPDSDYSLWSLWSMGDDATPQGVISHESALSVHGLSDILPDKVHLTVPKRFGTRAIPPVLILHRGELASGEIEARSGYRITTVRRTLTDLADTLSPELLIQALRQALDRGVLTQAQAESVPALRARIQDVATYRDAEPLYQLLKTFMKPQGMAPADYERSLRDMAVKLQPALASLFNWISDAKPLEALKNLLKPR